MAGDRYEIGDHDVLDDMFRHLNALLPPWLRIGGMQFHAQQIGELWRGLTTQSGWRQRNEERWLCFRAALCIRGEDDCGDMLCADSFDFTENEWAKLKNSALLHKKRVSEYS